MKPIPRRLLPHSIVCKPAASADGWNATPGTPVPISYVRMEPSSRIVTTKDGKQIILKSLLIYDVRTSSPTGITFTKGDAITFDGRDYKIIAVDPLYDARRLHHMEVGLT